MNGADISEVQTKFKTTKENGSYVINLGDIQSEEVHPSFSSSATSAFVRLICSLLGEGYPNLSQVAFFDGSHRLLAGGQGDSLLLQRHFLSSV